jgi:hypothetical protein
MDMVTDEVEYSTVGLRWQSSALLALQEATEMFLVGLFEDTCVPRLLRSIATSKVLIPVIFAPFMPSA